MNLVLQTRAPFSGMQTRLKAPDPRATIAPASYDPQARTVEAIVATDTPIDRWEVKEILVITKAAIDLSRAAGGRMALLLNHNQNLPIGNVGTFKIENGQLVATVRFADTPEGRKAEGQVARGELSQFSIGYQVRKWDERHSSSGIDTVRAVAWELYEVSLVSVPADKAAVVRSASPKGRPLMDPEDDVLEHDDAGAVAPQTRSPVSADPAEQERVRVITSLARSANLPQDSVERAIAARTSVEAFQRTAFEALASRPGQGGIVPGGAGPGMSSDGRISVGQDEGDTRIRGMSQELMRRMAREEAPRSDLSRRFHGISLVEMAADMIGHRGRIGHSTSAREQILKRAFHATSDFPMMFETATNGRMAERYAAAETTYRALCKRRDLSDFRPAPHYRPGDLPALEKLLEGGEIKYGTFSESREYLTVAPYAKAIAFTRQMLVNDDYGAIDDLLNSYGERVIAFEERLFWTLVLSASGAGPTLLATSRPIFNTTDGSLAASAGAITATTVSNGRAAMRKRKSLDDLFVQSEPKFIVAGPDKETEVDMLLATISATEVANVNPFAGKLTKVITPEIPGNGWYLFADPAKVPAFVYSLLEGYLAPRLTLDTPFESQGLKAKVEHDVGFAAIDHRGAWRNSGA